MEPTKTAELEANCRRLVERLDGSTGRDLAHVLARAAAEPGAFGIGAAEAKRLGVWIADAAELMAELRQDRARG